MGRIISAAFGHKVSLLPVKLHQPVRFRFSPGLPENIHRFLHGHSDGIVMAAALPVKALHYLSVLIQPEILLLQLIHSRKSWATQG